MFYHLTQRTLADTLRMLVEKSLEKGWQVAVRGTDRAELEALDAALWLGPEDSFLPHGLAGGDQDAAQPVLLGTGGPNVNAARCLMAVHSAPVMAAEVASFERVCILFDDADPAQMAQAREHWRVLTGAGISAQYWSEETGRWEKKRESSSSSNA